MPSSDDPQGPRTSPTRRRVLVGAGAGAGALLAWTAWDIGRQPKARVLAMAADSYDDDLVRRVRTGLQAFPHVLAQAKGGRVLLKPNLVEIHPDRPINTDVRLVAATAAAFLELGAGSVVVGEGAGHMRDSEALLELSGLDDRLHPLGVPFVDLNVAPVVEVSTKAGGRGDHTGLGKLPVAQDVMTADLVVSMPKLKTHHWAGVTLSMKNLFGTVPGAVFGWPKNPLHWAGIDNSIADIWSIVRPGFSIVDGIVGMEGDGPIMGTAVHGGALFFGDHCPAVDAVAARHMGLDPRPIRYLRKALGQGGTLHSSRIEVIGDSLDPVPFTPHPNFEFLARG